MTPRFLLPLTLDGYSSAGRFVGVTCNRDRLTSSVDTDEEPLARAEVGIGVGSGAVE